MLKDLSFPETLEYSSDGVHLPVEFFMQTIPECKRIDLKLGYFSSNAIRTLAYGFAQFIHNGGNLRIITNHYLSYQDKLLLFEEEESQNILYEAKLKYSIENDVEELVEILKNGDHHFYNCLKYLLKQERLQIIPIKLKPGRLAHFKQGILDDGSNHIYFNGSCNFTYMGLIDNGESMSIARSWGERSEQAKVKENIENIDSICSKEDPRIEYLNPDQIIEVVRKTGQDKDIDELIEEEINIYRKISQIPHLKSKVSRYIKKFEDKVKKEKRIPKFPYPDGPRKYQQEAYENWTINGNKGIFAMATGTGKTITSLNCLLNLHNHYGTYKAIIIVPTIALLDQWKEECMKFNYKNIVTVSSKKKWSDKLAFLNTSSKLIETSYIVIVTYASFSRPKFMSHLKLFNKNTLLIADEMHNMGAPRMLKILSKVSLPNRIGLSATPSRQYDIEGNKAIEIFFGDKYPFVYSYSMKEALDVGWLSKYTYHPHIVTLTAEELKDYIQISKRLLIFIDPSTGKYKDCLEVEQLLLNRKRIIHKASNKKDIFKDIIIKEFKKRGNLKYTLVYVPEGVDPQYVDDDYNAEDDIEIKLITEFTKIVKDIDYSIFVKQFTSNTPNREKTLKDFESGETHVLTSMKCLDEGVDVPRAELAIFCASTGNPRQFIQRRGRVLRKHIDKVHAVIHDLVVVPEINSDEAYFEMEKNLIKSELSRVVDFAQLSMNKIDTYEELRTILEYYNINLTDILTKNN